MKDRIIPLLIVIAVILTTIFFTKKAEDERAPIDALGEAFAGIENSIPDNSNISVLDLADSTDFVHFYCWSRYILAPRYLARYANECDTVLILARINTPDNIIRPIMHNKRILWKHQDSSYAFFLTSSH